MIAIRFEMPLPCYIIPLQKRAHTLALLRVPRNFAYSTTCDKFPDGPSASFNLTKMCIKLKVLPIFQFSACTFPYMVGK